MARFVIVGAGAIGGVVAALLHQAGHAVQLVARGAHHDAIAATGLTFETPGERVTLPLAVARSPADVSFDADTVILLATKSQDTAAAVQGLRAAADPDTPVVCLQNGIENERLALRSFGNVYGAMVIVQAAHLGPGIVETYSTDFAGAIDIGRYPHGVDDACEMICEAIRMARLDAQSMPDVMRMKNAKLIGNCGNAVQAICGMTKTNQALVDRAREEGRAILRAAGIPFAEADEFSGYLTDRFSQVRFGEIGGRRDKGGSTWQSVTRRAVSAETDFLNGEIVLHGRLIGMSAPVNELLCELMHETLRDRHAPGWLRTADILARI